MNMVIQHRRQQVVGELNSVEVAGEVQVDVFHWNNLGVASAGSAAFHSENRAETGFTQTNHGILANAIECITQTHCGGGFALAGWRRADCGYQHQFAIRFVRQTGDKFRRYFRLVMTVGFDLVFWNAEPIGCQLTNSF